MIYIYIYILYEYDMIHDNYMIYDILYLTHRGRTNTHTHNIYVDSMFFLGGRASHPWTDFANPLSISATQVRPVEE